MRFILRRTAITQHDARLTVRWQVSSRFIATNLLRFDRLGIFYAPANVLVLALISVLNNF